MPFMTVMQWYHQVSTSSRAWKKKFWDSLFDHFEKYKNPPWTLHLLSNFLPSFFWSKTYAHAELAILFSTPLGLILIQASYRILAKSSLACLSFLLHLCMGGFFGDALSCLWSWGCQQEGLYQKNIKTIIIIIKNDSVDGSRSKNHACIRCNAMHHIYPFRGKYMSRLDRASYLKPSQCSQE